MGEGFQLEHGLQQAERYFDAACLKSIKEEITSYGGREVLMGGMLGADGLLGQIVVLARGSKQKVPAVIEEARGYDVVIHNHPSTSLTPSPEDLYAAGVLSEDDVGFYIVSNDVHLVYIVTHCEKKTSPKVKPKLNDLDLTKIFQILDSQNKELTKFFPEYVPRQSQKDMLQGVVSAFNKKEHYICEAPTGTGKSLAYILPTLLWAHQNKEKTVISTHTILLQEQLLRYDIPLAKKLTGLKNIRVEFVKGRSNYLCYRKFHDMFREGADETFFDRADRVNPGFMALQRWGEDTKTGELSDFRQRPHGSEALKRYGATITCESDTCKTSNCRHHQNGKCFYTNARIRQRTADVLIVNHATLVIDLAIKAEQAGSGGRSLLPRFDRLIIDEGHQLEDVALRHLGSEATRGTVLRTLRNIAPFSVTKTDAANKVRGALVQLRKHFARLTKDPHKAVDVKFEAWRTFELAITRKIEEFMGREEQLCTQILGYLKARTGQNAQTMPLRSQTQFSWTQRIKKTVTEEADWENFLTPLREWLEGMDEIHVALEAAFGFLKKLDLDEEEEIQFFSALHDAQAYQQRLREQAMIFGGLIESEKSGEVKWVEAKTSPRRRGFNVSACQYPLSIGKRLCEILWTSLDTVILTSATLSTNGNFSFLEDHLGLNGLSGEMKKRLHFEQMKPHFPYHKNCGFYVPQSDFPQPNDRAFHVHARELIASVVGYLRGRTLILCTSYQTMERLAHELKLPLERDNIAMMVQGQHMPHAMIAALKENAETVLLGVDSFWEGIDIKGEHLSCVIMTKLPFPNPKEPLTEGQLEFLSEKKKNSFKEFSIPKAILKYKQGFGRLIRGEKDRGVFILLDRRIETQYYGSLFKRSLPVLKPLNDETALQAVEKFFS